MSILGRRGAAIVARELPLPASSSSILASHPRAFSIFSRPQPKYPGHVPLNAIERGALAVGSAVGALMNPRRAGTSPVTRPSARRLQLTLRRPHRSVRRSYRNPLLHLPPPRRHALRSDGPPDSPRPTTHHLHDAPAAIPSLAAGELGGPDLRRLARPRGRVARHP